jgi:hypothetical protein
METHHYNARLSIYEMGDMPAFVIKGDVPLETHISFTCIIEDVQYEYASSFCHRSRHVSDINLTETR